MVHPLPLDPTLHSERLLDKSWPVKPQNIYAPASGIPRTTVSSYMLAVRGHWFWGPNLLRMNASAISIIFYEISKSGLTLKRLLIVWILYWEQDSLTTSYLEAVREAWTERVRTVA